jgi:uncharacterized protein YutE (UPF0331/DUF86 family)
MELDKELIQLRIDIIERNLEEIKKIVDEGYEKFKLERNLSEKLQEMAKFRNLLVHRYAETEKEKLFKINEDGCRRYKGFYWKNFKIYSKRMKDSNNYKRFLQSQIFFKSSDDDKWFNKFFSYIFPLIDLQPVYVIP